VNFLNSKKAAFFCFISGICLLALGVYVTPDSGSAQPVLGTRQAWYYITGVALSVSGVVQLMRDETI